MTPERYRKLPGHRRGFLRGASVWIGADHLLAVRSIRVREEYKRFYLRDVQAISVAQRPRFHLSTRSFAIAWVLLALYMTVRARWPWADLLFGILAVCLVSAWAIVSSRFSCRCRIYTAVSRDELPSVYRTWTAHRFVEKVAPMVEQAQGKLEGNWTEALQQKGVGPVPEGTSPAAESPAPAVRVRAKGTPPVYAFLGILVVDAVFTALTLRAEVKGGIFWAGIAIALARVAAAIVVLVQYFRKQTGSAMRNVAVISLVASAILAYIPQINSQIMASRGVIVDPFVLRVPLLGIIDIAISVVLALAGLVILFRQS
jgi:hypothetical protein